MPKSRNLPMTTREPISDAKAREFLLPSSSWGSHPYGSSSYREEPWALGRIAYIGYYCAKNSKSGSLRVWLVTFWWRVRCWVLIGSPFLGLIRISRAGQGFWLVHRWWGWGQGISKGSFPGTLKNGVALILHFTWQKCCFCVRIFLATKRKILANYLVHTLFITFLFIMDSTNGIAPFVDSYANFPSSVARWFSLNFYMKCSVHTNTDSI